MYHEYRDTNVHSESKVLGVFLCYTEYDKNVFSQKVSFTQNPLEKSHWYFKSQQ